LAISAASLGTASAQDVAQAPTPARDFTSYYAQEEAPAAPALSDDAAVVSDFGAAASCGCGGGGCSTCCPLDCPELDPWRLFPCDLHHGISVSGWLEAGYTLNAAHPQDGFNGPVTFNDRDREGMMNQLYLSFERAVDNGGCGWDWGGRVDFLYGTDARFTTANGLEDNWNENHRFYGIALPQAYLEVAYNDLNVKIGHFYTIIGYEVVPAPGNFFYSHAYTMQYGEPFTHTGALASYAMSDTTTLMGGVTNGWDNWEDDNNDMSFLGGIAWDGGNGRTLALTTSIGNEVSPDSDDDDLAMYSIVFSDELTDRWTYVFQHDAGNWNNGAGGGQDAEWYGVNQYLFYDINCCWTFGLRAEWFRDDDGIRVNGIGDGNTIAGDSFVGDFFEVSMGLNYNQNANLNVRPELRMDWYDEDGSGGPQPYDDGQDDDQFTAAIDAILLW
jgi:hypothetical protein